MFVSRLWYWFIGSRADTRRARRGVRVRSVLVAIFEGGLVEVCGSLCEFSFLDDWYVQGGS